MFEFNSSFFKPMLTVSPNESIEVVFHKGSDRRKFKGFFDSSIGAYVFTEKNGHEEVLDKEETLGWIDEFLNNGYEVSVKSRDKRRS